MLTPHWHAVPDHFLKSWQMGRSIDRGITTVSDGLSIYVAAAALLARSSAIGRLLSSLDTLPSELVYASVGWLRDRTTRLFLLAYIYCGYQSTNFQHPEQLTYEQITILYQT